MLNLTSLPTDVTNGLLSHRHTTGFLHVWREPRCLCQNRIPWGSDIVADAVWRFSGLPNTVQKASKFPHLQRARQTSGADIVLIRWPSAVIDSYPKLADRECEQNLRMAFHTRTTSGIIARQFYHPSLRIFMHAVGLHGPHAAVTKPPPFEQPKVLIDPRLHGVLLRSCIHLLPISTTIIIAWLNLTKRFVGYNFKSFVKLWPAANIHQIIRDSQQDGIKLASLLLAAKLYELLVVASLSAIIFHQIRQEIIFGDGVPFGILPSGLSFSQLSFLWTREYWAATNARGKSWRLSSLVVFIGLCSAGVADQRPFRGADCTPVWMVRSRRHLVLGLRE